jgi:hypothetical protein
MWRDERITLPELEAECDRRECETRARAAQRHAHAEWEDAAYAQYQAACDYCRGDHNMLSEAGRATGREAWPMLWQGGREAADRLASDELITFWDYTQKRIPGPGEIRDSRAAGQRGAQREDEYEREAHMTTTPTTGSIAETVAADYRKHLKEVQAEHAAMVARCPTGALERAQAHRDPIDGAALLSNVCKWLKRYLYLDSDAKYWALTLWIAGSHFRDETGVLVHETYPIAGFFSSEPGSGKTHALKLLSILCPAAPGILVEPSEAAVALLIAKHHRTLLLDEGDILFGSGKRKVAIRAIFNSGFEKGGTWDRVRKGDVDSIRTDGAKALAALSVLKTGTDSALTALLTRIVEWEMHKPPAGVVIHKLRETFSVVNPATGLPEIRTGHALGLHLNGQLADWAAQERDALTAMTVELPAGVELRDEDKWLAMLGVAARAEANRQDREDEDARDAGDDWAELAWAACVDMSLYGGTPDTTTAEADMLAGIMNDWED